MIFEELLKILMMLLSQIINMIMSAFPQIEAIATNIAHYIGSIINYSATAFNFVHFMVGDSLPLLLTIILPILGCKYLLLPVIDLARRAIPFLNL